MMPQNANDWISLLAQSIGLVLLIGGLVGKWLNGRLSRMIERIASAETGLTAQGALMSDLQRKMQASEFDRHGLHQQIGELRAIAEKNAEAFNRLREDRHRDHVEMIERLARMEANTNLAGSLEKIGDDVVAAIELLTKIPPPRGRD